MRRALISALAWCGYLALFVPATWAATTGTPSPYVALQFFDNSGVACNGCKLFTYTAGTSTKVNTYTDSALSVANTNPIVLDSAGRCTIFLQPGNSYKFILSPSTDTDPPVSPITTRDNVSAVPPPATAADVDVTGTAGESIGAGDPVYLSDGSGGKTGGRWYRADAANTYSSTASNHLGIAPSAVSSAATGSFRVAGRVTGLSSLTAGTLYYIASGGGLTGTAPTNARAIAQADTTTSAVIGAWVPITAATSTVAGGISLAAQDMGTGIKNFIGAPTHYPGTQTTDKAVAGGVTFTDHSASNGATGAGTDAVVTTIKGNEFSASTKKYHLHAEGTLAANANNKTWTFTFGGTALLTFPTVAANNYSWQLDVWIYRITTASQQTLTYTLITAPIAAGGGATVYRDRTTATKDLTTDLAIKITIISGTASGDIKFDTGYTEVLG